ncbi:MAG: hypothetical protein FWC72_07945, partial [Oscillospiraceae bacterium]|nr:hypothetical protein [Oscillospiraceae bacterium]
MEFDILGGSGLYRLLGRILAGIENSVRQSAIARLIMAVRAWAVGSVIVRGATRLADGVGVSIQNSAILGRLLREDEVGCYRERGIVFRLYLAVLEFLRWGFRKLKVDRLLGGSVLLRPYLWVICVLAMVPLMPTMALLGLVLLSAFSLVLTMLKDQTRTLAYSAVN